MTPDQIQLVKESWKSVLPIKSVIADIFHDRLFEAAPDTRALFLGDMDQQKTKLMATLGAAISGLCHMELLVPTLEELGRRHRCYGVLPAHYDMAGECLIGALEQGLGDVFTPEVKTAWTAFYGLVANAMIKGAREIRGAHEARAA